MNIDMRLTKKYRIWWNANKELWADPLAEYNEGSVTVADDIPAGISGSFESDSIEAVQDKIAAEGLQVVNNEIL
ncbi:MAG: hypothetical protein PHC31_01130 [Clostridia bacterium]|nr:hypothetical protein [Clostridia bacterium]MDD3970497.1 hypothetical protein [Clostridia bacterium]